MTDITRRHVAFAIALTLPCVCLAQAQNPSGGRTWGISWTKIPTIIVLGRTDDAQVQLVRDAVQFWNRIFTELGTPFRLGVPAFSAGALPVDQLKALSDQVLSQTGVSQLPAGIYEMQGDIIVALSDGDFVSFASRRPSRQKALVAIKGFGFYPMTLPNVARNVIAHEMGHAIGLGHNSDPTMLMCGRPASCPAEPLRISDRKIFPTDNGRASDVANHVSRRLAVALTSNRVRTTCAVLLLIVIHSRPASSEVPEGTWLFANRVAVQVFECSGLLCGRIVWLLRPRTPTGQPDLDHLNPDPSLRQRHLCGLTIIWGLQPDRPGHWSSGWLYDPQDGVTYDVTAELTAPNTISARVYRGVPIFGRAEMLIRDPQLSFDGRC